MLVALIAAFTWLWYFPQTDGSQLTWSQTNLSDTMKAKDPVCGVSFEFRSKNTADWELVLPESRVKMEYGRWISLYYDIGGKPLCDKKILEHATGRKKVACSCEFKLDCSFPRQYQLVFQHKETGDKRILYYPADSTFTTNNQLKLDPLF